VASPVTVVILTHDRCAEVVRTVERTLKLPERPPVIVVDNASSDGTALALARFGPEVEVVQSPGNLGAAGRNLGVSRARTPYVALSDDDTWFAPGSLSAALALLDANRRLAVVTGHVLIGEEGRDDPTCLRMARSPLADACSARVPVVGFMGGACVVRRSAFLAAGGFEPRLFIGGEEALLALDLLARGWRMAYAPAVVVHHHPSRQRDTSHRELLLARNAVWTAWLRRPLPRAARLTAAGALAWLRRPSELWPIIDSTVRAAAWLVRKRRVVPREVEHMLREVERYERAVLSVKVGRAD
jgi:GT2 family glycosyltransferase